MNILKWIGIGILIWWGIAFLKNLILFLMYKYNKNYKDYCDKITAQELIQKAEENKRLEEQERQSKLTVLVSQWTQTANYYYFYYEKGVLMPDYAYMLDLLTQQIITLLGGDYTQFRNQISELLKGKQIKDGRVEELEDKGIPPCPKDIKPSDFEKRKMTDDDIDKLLDEWQKKFGKQDKKDDTKEDK
jgi:hypothetical protein